MMKAPHSKGANCAMCDGGMCKMADGGEVKGVHSAASDKDPGTSVVGKEVRSEEGMLMKGMHKQKLGELKSMPKPITGKSGFAEGGDVEADDGDEELSHGLGKELMGAFESKDHKKLMSSLEACVLHCMNKGDSDD